MKLLIIHGPPASGKLTLAKALAARLNYGILHNHLTVDLALQVYPEFGGADFFEFIDGIRTACIQKACDNQLDGLILTLCYDKILDRACVKKWVAIVETSGGEVMPIYLKASLSALKIRAANSSRIGTNKINTTTQLESTLAQYNFGAIEYPPAYAIDTDTLDPQESANAIIRAIG